VVSWASFDQRPLYHAARGTWNLIDVSLKLATHVYLIPEALEKIINREQPM
jgi:hypothetical protein